MNILLTKDIVKILKTAFVDLEEIQSVEFLFGSWVATYRRKGLDFVQDVEFLEDRVVANTNYTVDVDILQDALNDYLNANTNNLD